MRIGVTFDADHRKNDDRCRFICRTSEAHDAPLVWEFDNGAHQPSSPAAGKERHAFQCTAPEPRD